MTTHNNDWFKKNRKEQYQYINEKVSKCDFTKHLIINAPVKSGKRIMVEISSLLEKGKHIFLTALHRKADESQREELRQYNIVVHSINNKKKLHECIKDIKKQISKNERIIIHFDECDFGVGKQQLLSSVYKLCLEYPNIQIRKFSATPEVARDDFRKFQSDNCMMLPSFQPHPCYFGIKKYLEEGRFYEAEDFITVNNENPELSEQAKTLLQELKDSSDKKNIGIVRLAGTIIINEERQQKYDVLKDVLAKEIKEKYNIRCKFISTKDDKIDWDDEEFWGDHNPGRRYLYIICQVAGRSTEWKCHPYLKWYHCKRTDSTPVSTQIQDQERVNHYKTSEYNHDNEIKLYGNEDIAKYSAKLIDMETLIIKMGKRPVHGMLKRGKEFNFITNCKYCDTFKEVITTLNKHKISHNIRENKFINEKNKFSKRMQIGRKTYDIKNYDKYSNLENFYTSNVRTQRKDFIIKEKGEPPVWFKSKCNDKEKVGISDKTQYRVHVYYDDGETNFKNYKFLVKWYIDKKECEFKNTSMFNET